MPTINLNDAVLYEDIPLNRFYRTEKVVIFGDSITADNITGLNTTLTSRNHFGYFNVLDALMGGRFDFTSTDNLGIAGNTTTQMVTRLGATASGAGGRVLASLDTVLASGATLAFFLGGTNDINTGVTPPTPPNIAGIKANIKTIIDRIISNTTIRSANGSQVGCRVVVMPILPRQTWSNAVSNAIAQANLLDINDHIKTYCATKPRDQVIFVENISKVFDAGYNPSGLYDPSIDYTLVTGTPTGVLANNNFLRDTTHPSQIGALILGKEIQKLLQPIIGHANSTGEIFNRLDRSKQKLFNHEFRREDGGASSGTLTGITLTGTIPNSWVRAGSNDFATQGNHTVDFSRDPIDGKLIVDFQSFNGATAGQQVNISQIVTAVNGGYMMADNLQTFLDIEYLECVNAQAVMIRNSETATVNENYYGNFASAGALPLLDKELKRGLWATPRYAAGAGVTQTQILITFLLDSSLGKTARIKAKLHGVHFIKY